MQINKRQHWSLYIIYKKNCRAREAFSKLLLRASPFGSICWAQQWGYSGPMMGQFFFGRCFFFIEKNIGWVKKLTKLFFFIMSCFLVFKAFYYGIINVFSFLHLFTSFSFTSFQNVTFTCFQNIKSTSFRNVIFLQILKISNN